MDWKNSEFAQVETLSAEYADKILSAPSIRRVRTLYLTIFPLAIMAGVGLFIWAAMCYQEGVDGPNASKKIQSFVFYSIDGIIFAGLILTRFYVGTRNMWLSRVAKNEINRRPNKIVNPEASGVRFVEIVPKSNWNDTTLIDNASDVGFLAIDFQNRCLLYEGDNERYRIPAKAIVKYEQDSYTRLIQDPYSKGANNKIIYYHFIVATVKISETAATEIPFRIRKTVSLWSDKKLREENYKFFCEVSRLKSS
jgi:hypothetical protein